MVLVVAICYLGRVKNVMINCRQPYVLDRAGPASQRQSRIWASRARPRRKVDEWTTPAPCTCDSSNTSQYSTCHWSRRRAINNMMSLCCRRANSFHLYSSALIIYPSQLPSDNYSYAVAVYAALTYAAVNWCYTLIHLHDSPLSIFCPSFQQLCYK